MSDVELEVLATGPLVTVQDRGRPGHAHLGVPRSGALDAAAHALAQRLVGNEPGAAGLEVLMGGLTVRLDEDRWVAVTGAEVPLRLGDRAVPTGRALRLPTHTPLTLGTPLRGARSHLAVSGGLVVDPVLGSRSTDTLSGLGPPPVRTGDRLPVGAPAGVPAAVEVPPAPPDGPLRLHPGPRADWCDGDPVDLLVRGAWTCGPDSDRVGLRLEGGDLPRARTDELASEGVLLGAVQLPPGGRPVVFLADHPTTGGYPVVAVVEPADLWRCAQLRPGDPVRFSRAW